MASLQKTYNNRKLTGQVYTPKYIVNKILDDISYNSKEILGKTILDPACGDGRFLIEIAKRIIEFSSISDLEKNLSKIIGWDIDNSALKEAEIKLNSLIEGQGIKVNWQLKNFNSLHCRTDDLWGDELVRNKFDYIVGNPPYIRIQHLLEEQRKYIQKFYKFCKSGSTDIYIAFFELAMNLLKENGTCGYITPNTFFNTETAGELRKCFENKQFLKQITNYGHIQLFDNATTYSAITVFNKIKNNNFKYQFATTNNQFEERNIDIKEIKGKRFWQLSVEKETIEEGVRLGDICDIHVGVTTLADKVYIFKTEDVDNNTVIADTKFKGKIKLEKGLLKPIIKVSTLKSAEDKVYESIIFPYENKEGKNEIINETRLQELYPLTYNYLISAKEILDKRDNGKPNKVAWYAFGRTQSLNTSFGKKILFSPMNKKPNFILSDDDKATFYSGYCIKYKGNKKELLESLNSERMEKFIQVSARDFRGGWKAYNKKIVQEFIIDIN